MNTLPSPDCLYPTCTVVIIDILLRTLYSLIISIFWLVTMLQKMKKCAFVGAPFCGGPVRPNMLNMPKSASAACLACQLWNVVMHISMLRSVVTNSVAVTRSSATADISRVDGHVRPSRSFKVTDIGTNQKPTCHSLLLNNTNLHPPFAPFRSCAVLVES